VIIEFFGPPGSGKTTFSLTLADRLRAGGYSASLRLGARPGEEVLATGAHAEDEPSTSFKTAARRLIFPAYELISKAGGWSTNASPNGRVASMLSKALPQGQILRSLRMRQYLYRLSNVWAQAGRSQDIWLFDQAYIQAVASIALVQPGMTDESILALLQAAPHADIAFRLEAPLGDLEARLGRRHRHIGGLGRMLEETSVGVLEHAALAKRIEGLLLRLDRQVLTLSSVDDTFEDNIGIAERAALNAFSGPKRQTM
jgi:RecA/RadA recombinase